MTGGHADRPVAVLGGVVLLKDGFTGALVTVPAQVALRAGVGRVAPKRPGVFALANVRSPILDLHIAAEGFLTLDHRLTLRVPADPLALHAITLMPAPGYRFPPEVAVLYGRVVRASDRTPVAGAVIDAGDAAQASVATGACAPDGRFVVPLLSATTDLTVTVTAPGFASQHRDVPGPSTWTGSGPFLAFALTASP